MPRPWTLKIEDFPPLRRDRQYRLRVVTVEKAGAPAGIRATLEHLDQDQAGRRHVLDFRLPIRPAGLAAQFFRACGLYISVGATVAPVKALGQVIRVRLAPTADGELKPVSFEPDQENPDGRQPS